MEIHIQTGRRSQRRKISDTAALSQFIQDARCDRSSRSRRTRAVLARPTSAPPPKHKARARSSDAIGIDVNQPPVITVKEEHGQNHSCPVLQRPPAAEILNNGGLRQLLSMSVFLTQDERIILADPGSGMAALVTGVAQVGDAELATIAAAQKACLPLPPSSNGADHVDTVDGEMRPKHADVAPDSRVSSMRAPGHHDNLRPETDPQNEIGASGLAGALAGLLALKTGEPPEDQALKKGGPGHKRDSVSQDPSAASGFRSPKMPRCSTPPSLRPRSVRATRRNSQALSAPQPAADSPPSPGSPSHSPPKAAPVRPPPAALPYVPPIVAQCAAAPKEGAMDTAEPSAVSATSAILPPAFDMWHNHSSPPATTPLSCMSLPAALMTMIGSIPPSSAAPPLPLPQSLAHTVVPSLLPAPAVPPRAPPPPFTSTHSIPPHLLRVQQLNTNPPAAVASVPSKPLLPIDQLCNAGCAATAPATAAQVQLLPAPGLSMTSQPLTLTSVRPQSLLPDLAEATVPTLTTPAAVSQNLSLSQAEAPPPPATATASVPQGGAQLAQNIQDNPSAHEPSSLNQGMSVENSLHEAETSQNITDSSLRVAGSEFTSHVSTSDPALFPALLPPFSSTSNSMGGKKVDLAPVVMETSGSQAQSAGSLAKVTAGEQQNAGRQSSLKQDNADIRTLQRRARNRDAARRTRMKKMLLLQGGESRVMSLADEVEAHTAELKSLQQQVQDARSLNERLRAKISGRENPLPEGTLA